ncbi:MAG TPA: 16S rRNA (cytidine(1402)-2'-O)-methyltransferase [Gemmatimonadaceae bacterium]|nr:16S rRNA (cytidine(1402)-2'-O)-methyltransferase [Gemmatimonadaceae bacterium]
MPGTLYLVSTPIGNLGDITFRAVDILRSVALIVAEDTRHSRALLDRYQIATPVEAHHEHNEARATPKLVGRLSAGESIALITDAGTPLLSDPGARLVRGALDAGVDVVPIPGASALLAALVASGLDTDRFTFFGFLARKGRERKNALLALQALEHTAVLYEAPNRVADTLAELVELGMGTRQAVVARELTKQFEELKRGTVESLARYYADTPARGEVVLVISGAEPTAVDESSLRERARSLRGSGHSARDTARVLVEELGAPRNLAYRLAHEAEPEQV